MTDTPDCEQSLHEEDFSENTECTGIFGSARPQKTPASREEIIRMANEMIKKDWEYMDGMEVNDALQRDEAIVLRGEFFLDAQGLPTPKTNAVFNMFHRVSVELSRKYRIAQAPASPSDK